MAAITYSTVTIRGRITYIGELKEVGKNASKIRFGVAIGHSRRNKNDEWEEVSSTIIYVEAWNKLAENIFNSFTVGDLVTIQGALHTDAEYTNREGETVTPDVYVRAEDVAASARLIELELEHHGGRTPGSGSSGGGGKSTGGKKKAAPRKQSRKAAPADSGDSDAGFFDDDDEEAPF